MRLGVVHEDGHDFQVVCDDRYYHELCVYLRDRDWAAIQAAQEMEADLLLARGYPEGSYAAPGALPDVDAREWEDALWAIEEDQRGAARKALQWIDEQRIYEKR